MGTFPLTAYVSVQSLPRRCLSCQPKFEAHSELQSTHFVAAVSDQPELQHVANTAVLKSFGASLRKKPHSDHLSWSTG